MKTEFYIGWGRGTNWWQSKWIYSRRQRGWQGPSKPSPTSLVERKKSLKFQQVSGCKLTQLRKRWNCLSINNTCASSPASPATRLQPHNFCLRTHCVSIVFPPFSFPQGFQAATCQFCHTPSSANLVAGMNYRLFQETGIQAKVKGCFNQTRLKEYQEFDW